MGAPTLYTVIAVFLWIASSPPAIAHDEHQRSGQHYRHQHSPHCHAQQRRERARWEQWHRQQHAGHAHHRHHDNSHGHRQNIVIYRGPQGLTPKYRSTIRTQTFHQNRLHSPHRLHYPETDYRGIHYHDSRLRIELGRSGIQLRF